jgi:iron complex outermembrane receptor protein
MMKKLQIFLMALLLLSKMSAQINVSGTVVDSKNEVLAGATIKVNQSFLATSTDKNGQFNLNLPKSGKYSLSVSFIGFKKIDSTFDISANKNLSFLLKADDILTDEIVVSATRAGNTAPFAYSNINRDEIQKLSTMQDVPFLLQNTVSLINTSDAGTGVGYSSLRIRGSDLSRINVTVNGVPLNDAESHGVWWVDMPDFTQSVNSIQIQRGVGTSTNGAGAFGASINFQTNQLNRKPYAQISSNYGSFNTNKDNISFGTGLLNGKFTVDGRLSMVKSDGFIDRAFTDMQSYYLTAAYFSKKSMIRVIHYAGHEKTYQAWNGVPKVRLDNDTAGMMRYEEHGLYSHQQTLEMLQSNARNYNLYTYDNEIDNYWQKHYNLLFTHQFNANINFNGVMHYTHGEGYYEQYKENADFAQYGLANFTFANDALPYTNLVQQKWLNNDFYGFTSNLEYKTNKLQATIGGAWNQYLGNHYGNIIWAEYSQTIPQNYEWYRNKGIKTDGNIYTKINYKISNGLTAYVDWQFRQIGYAIYGTNDDLRTLKTDTSYNFFNPKGGLFYQINENNHFYISYAIANREPARDDFTNADAGKTPQPERLYDTEIGYKYANLFSSFELNFYYMSYQNQLIQTGELNNVGNAIMTNIPQSYRRGVEISAGAKLPYGFEWNGNITLSQNKAQNFTSYTDNWDYWNDPATEDFQKQIFFKETDLSFSPGIIASGNLIYRAPKVFTFSCESKYVGRQYIDNTQNINRSLHPYFVRNMHFMFDFNPQFVSKLSLKFSVFNFMNIKYESNAWVYRYFYEGKYYDMDGYFPQAGRNYSLGIVLTF